MKKVININFQGRVIPIEEAAYDILKHYVESLRSFFINEEGRDEIINDIEGRIGELFGEVLKKGSTCVTEDDVNAIIASMGRPEDFEDDEAKVHSQLGGNNKSQQSSSSSNFNQRGFTATTTGRFFRDENQRIIGGVCSGIANYFGIDPLVVRILFVVFAFAGFGFIVYLVLWVAVPSTASTVIGSVKKRLFRDPDNKLIAGVCSGLSNYFGVNIWIPRVLFLIPFITFASRWNHWDFVGFPGFLSLTFSPGTLLLYIVLWIVLPEALTTSEKLEMKGERVDLNSIKNTIKQDMEGFKDRAEKFGKEVGERAQQVGKEFGERGRQFGQEAGYVARRSGGGIGYAIGLMVKVFVYFIVGCIVLGLVSALFALGVFFSGILMPVSHYVLADTWQILFSWGALILFIWVPVVGIITWVIRRVAKMRNNSRVIRFTFVSLWLIGLFCVIGLVVSLAESFRYRNHTIEQVVNIPEPKLEKIEVKGIYPPMEDNDYWFHFRPFESFDGDSAYVRNTRIRITLADNDSFGVSIRKFANGPSREKAIDAASKIDFKLRQRDSVLYVNNFVSFTEKEKFRNQLVEITIMVPKNKKITVDESARGWGIDEHIDFGRDWNYNYQSDDEERNYDYGFERNVEYMMMPDGRLKRTHPKMEESDNNENEDENSTVAPPNTNSTDSNVYHYKPGVKTPKAPAKPAAPKKDSVGAKQAQTNVGEKAIIAIPAMFIQRFTI